MLVRALERGYDNIQVREPGEVFEMAVKNNKIPDGVWFESAAKKSNVPDPTADEKQADPLV
jgi:hypothetical protein